MVRYTWEKGPHELIYIKYTPNTYVYKEYMYMYICTHTHTHIYTWVRVCFVCIILHSKYTANYFDWIPVRRPRWSISPMKSPEVHASQIWPSDCSFSYVILKDKKTKKPRRFLITYTSFVFSIIMVIKHLTLLKTYIVRIVSRFWYYYYTRSPIQPTYTYIYIHFTYVY